MPKYTITIEVESDHIQVTNVLLEFEDTFKDQPGTSLSILRDGVEVGLAIVQAKPASPPKPVP